MKVVITYHVDSEQYYGSKHQISLVTTEYSYKSDMLVHLQIGKNLGIRLNNLLSYEFHADKQFPNEQFLSAKTYNQGKPKPTTRSTFENKLKRFDMSQTVIECEILEEYAYTDKNGKSAEVQIVITAKGDDMTAVIDFKDTQQHMNFVCPEWLTKP